MMATPPIVFRYQNGTMVPRSRAQADKWYQEGEVVALERYEGRSQASHNHYFAALHSAWMNLPEDISEQYPTPEHLRKRLLIEAGYCDVTHIVFTNNKDAVKAAAMCYELDDYSVAVAEDRILKRYVAQSQSLKAMGKADFQDSKTKVLELAAAMIGTTVGELQSDNATTRKVEG